MSTTDTIPGKEVIEILGMVSGTDNYVAGGMFGEGYLGKMGNAYMQSSLNSARNKMIDEAMAMGADGIISYKTTTSEAALNNIVVTVTGMAVKLRDVSEESDKTTGQAISGADEILKYKELLDMGIISQEEFDAKKKQILNL
ncbi:MAG: SHOCT domain-containing protein [Lachnospiraceae bacterium]|nr:SHOCT domain-containing protein [Lachnospiraceae bacterium]